MTVDTTAARPDSEQPPSLKLHVAELVGPTVKLARADERDDLVDRLRVTWKRLSSPDVRVIVVGEYKQGKSTLINALLGFHACPVDDDIATSVPTTVRHAEEAVAYVTRPGKGKDEEVRQEVPLDQAGSMITELGNPGNREGLTAAEIGIPSDLLKQGLVLIDTPGVGGIASAHNAATMAALPFADAVMFVSDASQELTAPELDFLHTARGLVPNIVCVLTKIDFYSEWRRILEINRKHLEAAGVVAGMVPVSSTLRAAALMAQEPRVNKESGFPQLIRLLREHVLARGEELAVRAATQDLLAVLEQLDEPHLAAVKVLKDPEQAGEVVQQLEKAKEQAEQLRTAGARWHQTLNDGFADLNSDVEYELRMRLRAISQEADEAIDQSQPGKIWNEFQSWLERRVTSEIADIYALVGSRTKELVDKVADHFEEAQPDIGSPPGVETPEQILQGIGGPASLQRRKVAVFSQGLNVIRSSYGGISMFGMVSNIAGIGMAMLNPVSIGIGVLLGGKAITDDRDRRLLQARAEAKQAHRKYVEEITLQVGKDSRDTLRRVQRGLRDAFQDVAAELQRSVSEALQSAQSAVRADQEKRGETLRAAESRLKAIETIKARVSALMPDARKSAS
jgi:tRNA U34 5-carboxymethylaminomethyl modifying GTPase MnmE/TrmE